MKPSVLILIGPPGSGKGTQAELLAGEFGLTHLESSKVIEEKFKNADPTDSIIAREKENWISGKLVNPTMVTGWILGEIEKNAHTGQGIVTSGSPRNLEEAEAEIPVLEELYGKDKIAVIKIQLSEEESIKRNSTRRICKGNRHPIPNFPEYQNLTVCPEDGSEIITRDLDKPEIIKKRYSVYLAQTEPVLESLKRRGYHILAVNGEQFIEAVHREILNKLDL